MNGKGILGGDRRGRWTQKHWSRDRLRKHPGQGVTELSDQAAMVRRRNSSEQSCHDREEVESQGEGREWRSQR